MGGRCSRECAPPPSLSSVYLGVSVWTSGGAGRTAFTAKRAPPAERSRGKTERRKWGCASTSFSGLVPAPSPPSRAGEAAWAALSCEVFYLCYRRCHPFGTACSAWSLSSPRKEPAAASWHRPESGHTMAPSTATRPWHAHCSASCLSTGYDPPGSCPRALTGPLW